MIENRVTVIGYTASGKTTYLAGMYHIMTLGKKHFSIYATNPDNDLYLEQLWLAIRGGDAPDPSDKMEKYAFHISHNRKPVTDFEWMDYPGGVLSQPNTKEFQDLAANIKESDCLLLILDGDKLFNIEASDIEDYKERVFENIQMDDGVSKEVKLFNYLSANNIDLPPVGIVVTKCDLIPSEYQTAIQEIIATQFEDIIEEKNRVVLPMSVSLGGKIEPGTPLRPYNVEQPIAFAVLAILLKYLNKARSQKDANNAYISNNSGLIKGFFNSEKVNRARQNSQALMQEIDKWSEDAFKLIDLFSEKKRIYVDGRERKLKEYYKELFRAISK